MKIQKMHKHCVKPRNAHTKHVNSCKKHRKYVKSCTNTQLVQFTNFPGVMDPSPLENDAASKKSIHP